MLETVLVDTDKLYAYENNAKIHTESQIEHIANSIRDFGFNDPVGVWTNEQGRIEIVTGHGAVQAAKKLGIKQVPCNFLDHLSDEERRAYCHVHNQTQLETGFEVESLIADMDNLNVDWDNYGFEAYCYNEEPEVTEDEVPEVVQCRAKPGEVWILGRHRVMCGSATNASDMEKLTGGGVLRFMDN